MAIKNLQSNQVKVFPSAFRGNGIDPESFLISEKNLTNISRKTSSIENYISLFDNGNVGIVLGGYCFEVDKDNIISLDSWDTSKPIYVGINVEPLQSSYEGITMDTLVDIEGNRLLDVDGDFVGLQFSQTRSELNACEYTLKLMVYEDGEWTLNENSFLKVDSKDVKVGYTNESIVDEEDKRNSLDDYIKANTRGTRVVSTSIVDLENGASGEDNGQSVINFNVGQNIPFKFVSRAFNDGESTNGVELCLTSNTQANTERYISIHKLNNNSYVYLNSLNSYFEGNTNTFNNTVNIGNNDDSYLGRLDIYGSQTIKSSSTGVGLTISSSATNQEGFLRVNKFFNTVSVNNQRAIQVDSTNISNNYVALIPETSDCNSLGLSTNLWKNVYTNNVTLKTLSGVPTINMYTFASTSISSEYSRFTVEDANSNSPITLAIFGNDGTSQYFKVEGNIIGNVIQGISDIRLKKNIKTFEPHKSILDLPIVEFDYKSDNSHHIGCIAQDLKEICPELVSEDANGYLMIEESKIVYLLIDEVKELKKEVEELKKK